MKLRILSMSLATVLSASVVTATSAQQREVMKACAEDMKAYCVNVERGEGRIAKCLKENESKLSATCKEKLRAAVDARERGDRDKRGSSGTPNSSTK
jgi:hypothetical protein